MKNGLRGQARCSRMFNHRVSPTCVASFITKESCEEGGGTWTKVIVNYKEKVSENSEGRGNIQSMKGVTYESHKITQGSENSEQDVVKVDKPDVIFAPSTVVNHNGMNMEGKFSSYKWKVPCFPSQTTQRCLLRIR